MSVSQLSEYIEKRKGESHMDKKQAVYDALSNQSILYTVMEHPAVYTMAEMDELGITEKGEVVKNLFVRNAKGKVHYLIILPKDKKADLKGIAAKLGSTALSFASEQRLEKHLGLTKGSVSPMGVINNAAHDVIVVFDKSLEREDKIGVHPNDNTATLWLRFEDLKRFVESCGNQVQVIDL